MLSNVVLLKCNFGRKTGYVYTALLWSRFGVKTG